MMSRVVGVNNVGVIVLENGEYIGWDIKKGRWFTTKDLNKAERILGDKELNASRVIEKYRRMTNDRRKAQLAIGTYIHRSDSKESGFIKESERIAFRYAYLEA